MEDTNEKLVSHIKTIFDDFNDGGSAQGWAKFQEKYPQKLPEVKKINLRKWWISGVAATTAIIAMASPFVYNKFIKDDIEVVEVKTDQKTLKNLNKTNLNAIDSLDNLHDLENSNIKPENNKTEVLKNINDYSGKEAQKNLKNQNEVNSKTENHNSEILKNINAKTEQKLQNNNSAILKSQSVITLKTEQLNLNRDTVDAKGENKNSELLKASKSYQMDKQYNIIKTDSVITQATAFEHTLSPILNPISFNQSVINKNDIVSRTALVMPNLLPDKTNIPSKKNTSYLSQKKSNKDDKKRVKKQREGNYFDIYTTALLSFNNKYSKINAGLGVNKNIRLSKALAISIGVGFSENSVEYQSSSKYSYNLSPTSSEIITEINDYKFNAKLSGFDLPIRLKAYPFKNQNFYLGIGVISSYYTDIIYDDSNTLTKMSSLGSTTSSRVLGSKGGFHSYGFEVFNSAIVAVGFNQKLGNNALTFEPYFKPVIRNIMGYSGLRVNSLGINLKYNFSSKK